MATLAIETQNLTKTYGGARGVTALNLSVNEGEVFGFLGPNGAGKTTTIRVLLDLIRPTSGHAKIFGQDAQVDSLAVKSLIGYLPGELSLPPNLTGAQTLEYLANLRGNSVERAFIAHLAGRLELDPSKKFGDYSRGNKQKVGLIQAFMHRPRLLILDEPTSGLDPLNQQEFYRMVDEVRADGRTVFLSSHILSEVERVSDRIGIIREGQLIREGRFADIAAIKFQKLEITLRDPALLPALVAELAAVDSLEGVEADPIRAGVVHAIARGHVLDRVIKILAGYPVADFVSHEPSLEDVFLSYYQDAAL